METVDDENLIQIFEYDCRIRDLSKHTIEGYVNSVRLLSSYLQDHESSLLAVDKEILKEYIVYLRAENISYKTMKNRFSAFSTFFDYLVYEDMVRKNIINDIRKRYLHRYKNGEGDVIRRKLISVEEMAGFIHSIVDIRDKAMALLLAKTGMRRNELVSIELDDVDWEDMSIRIKRKRKSSNPLVFFDYETLVVLNRWLKKRELIADNGNNFLFVSYVDRSQGINGNGVYTSFVKWAKHAGLFDEHSKRIEDRFTPHCCRHWFTTHLRRAGMSREFIQELRGDKRHDAIDVYHHIDRNKLKDAYLSCIPQLGII